MYDPINNQQFCTLQFRGTCWCHKQFQGTGWQRKRFQLTGWHRKQSKQRSRQRSKVSYLHYQRKISTKIIQQAVCPKDNPRRHPSDWPAGHDGFAGNMTDFGHAPYSAPKGDCQGRGAQCRANFPNSEGVKPDEQGRLHATRRQHQHSNHQVDSPKPNFNNNSNSPTTTGTQDIVNPIGPAGPHWISADQNLKTFIDELFDKNSGPRPSFSRVIGSELMGDPRVNVNLCIGMHFGSDSIVTQNPNFVNCGVASVNATDKLG